MINAKVTLETSELGGGSVLSGNSVQLHIVTKIMMS